MPVEDNNSEFYSLPVPDRARLVLNGALSNIELSLKHPQYPKWLRAALPKDLRSVVVLVDDNTFSRKVEQLYRQETHPSVLSSDMAKNGQGILESGHALFVKKEGLIFIKESYAGSFDGRFLLNELLAEEFGHMMGEYDAIVSLDEVTEDSYLLITEVDDTLRTLEQEAGLRLRKSDLELKIQGFKSSLTFEGKLVMTDTFSAFMEELRAKLFVLHLLGHSYALGLGKSVEEGLKIARQNSINLGYLDEVLLIDYAQAVGWEKLLLVANKGNLDEFIETGSQALGIEENERMLLSIIELGLES